VQQEKPGHAEPGSKESFAEEALDWFVRLQATEGDPQTIRGFRAWVESDERRAAAFEKVTEIWGAPEFLLATAKVAEKTEFSTRRRQSHVRKAGIGIAVILVALMLSKVPDMMIRLQADYVTATGEQRSIVLPDGSIMTLDADTAVVLDFSNNERGVKLIRGEAYFDVQHDPVHPFHVTGVYERVEVKGTAFSVQTGDRADEVVLQRGAVAVMRLGQPGNQTDLAPGEAVSVTATGIQPVKQIDARSALAWLDGRIIFNDRPLGEVLAELRRYYARRIYVADAKIEQLAVSGNYRLDQPALVIQSLAVAVGASMTTLPGGIIILH